MLVDDLYNDEFENITDTKLARTINLLKDVINDWPTEIETLEAFIFEVKIFLHCQSITIDVVDRKLSNVSLNEAWQIEALTNVRELMNINHNEKLENIVANLINGNIEK